MSCKYCEPLMIIRNTVFYKHLPVGDGESYGGQLGIIAWNGKHYLRYENTADIFYSEVAIDERRPINNCPMCGRKLVDE